ncbi:FAD-binding-3 domain-containing protein [Mycena venus]|uniref:FAD-binding-3 domain-containing protein n=1 Tax=Mycena venus TaxID=2733690 RepID=A0A8H7CGN1_9AGAR|nr:FAD-binding-3 domain-containing protein [Mycena venus]
MTDSANGLNFIIVGASIAGLAAAIALKASGHNVLVLEKEPQLGGTSSIPSGCARVPPNGTKILFDWGLDAKTKEYGAIVEGLAAYKYEGTESGRDFLGIHLWDPELLTEARGNFVHFRHQDLLRILYDATIKPPRRKEERSAPRVSVLFGAEVVQIDPQTCTATLRSGETHVGDAIIGADGVRGVVRRTLMGEEGVLPGRDDVPSGLTLYRAVIPKELAVNDPDLTSFYDYPQCTASMGSNRGALTFVAGKDRDITLCVYTPDSSQDGNWGEEADQKLADVLGPCDVGIRKLAALAGPATCIQLRDQYKLESWVSTSGRVVVLGEAAHPFPPVSLHTYSIALEDGAFIGKIFSHTKNRNRIPEFLHAFQEHREPRCSRIRDTEKQYIGGITLQDGEMQAWRDAAMRANHAAGKDVMDSVGGDAEQMLEDTRMVFGYGPADDADEWWMTWGRYRGTPKVPVDDDRHKSWSTFSSITGNNDE